MTPSENSKINEILMFLFTYRSFIFFHLAKTIVITVVFQQNMVAPNLELSMSSTFGNKTIHTPEMKPIGRWTRGARTLEISQKSA